MEFNRIYRLSLVFTTIVLIVFLFLGFVIYPKNPVFNGLVFGTTVSVIYILMLSYRIKRLDNLPLEKIAGFMKVGAFMRFALIIISLMLIFNSPQFNLKSAGLALLVGPFMIGLVGLLDTISTARKGE